MRLGVVGGKLQGTEAAYLGAVAGYEVVLIDRRPERPASGLAHETHVFDVTVDPRRARRVLGSCDAVLPACEDDDTLAWLAATVPGWGVPLLFDAAAYEVTSSKVRSRELFARLGAPLPAPWPACGFPVVVKPSRASGSAGVRVVWSEAALQLARAACAADGDEVVVEQFVAGPSLSLEVLAREGTAVALQPTLLEFDAVYDCKRVVAPVEDVPGVDDDTVAALAEVSCDLARALCLTGVMDVEVMVHGGVPFLLEIDARLPSQTPAAVYHSCGSNVVAGLVETVLEGAPPAGPRGPVRGAVYEHVQVRDGRVEVLGEHVVGGAGPLRRHDGLFGADVVLTDRDVRADEWVAVLITSGVDAADARLKSADALCRLAKATGCEIVPERGPVPEGESA